MRLELKKEWTIPSGVGLVSFGVGVGVGYFLTKRKIQEVEEQWEEVFEESNLIPFDFSASMDENYDAIQELTNHLSQTDVEESEEVEVEPTEMNIFTADENWDYAKELQNRDPERPYILHRDEYFANEKGFRQTTLNYYEGDNILCDELDVPIYNPESVVGILEFGKGSGDKSVVYVRNEKLDAEFEVLLDQGHYQVEVLGQHLENTMEAEDIKHSHSPRKFRTD